MHLLSCILHTDMGMLNDCRFFHFECIISYCNSIFTAPFYPVQKGSKVQSANALQPILLNVQSFWIRGVNGWTGWQDCRSCSIMCDALGTRRGLFWEPRLIYVGFVRIKHWLISELCKNLWCSHLSVLILTYSNEILCKSVFGKCAWIWVYVCLFLFVQLLTLWYELYFISSSLIDKL